MWEECFSGQLASSTDVPSTVDQTETEETARNLLELGLPFLQPSLECELSIRPFICLYLFGVCDANSEYHQISKRECLSMRDEICIREWIEAENYLDQDVLPHCELLPDQTDKCVGE